MREKTPAELGVKPSKKLSVEAMLVTVPDGDIGDPTDLDIEGSDWDFDRDGAIPDYPDDRVVAEINQAVTTKEK